MGIRISWAAAGILAILLTGAAAVAGEMDFHTTADEMIDVLTRPSQKYRSLAVEPQPSQENVSPDTEYRVPSSGQAVNRAIAVVERPDEDGETIQQVAVENTLDAPRVRTKVLFDFDSATVRPESYGLLAEVAIALNSERLYDEPVVISGHADSDGPEDYNLNLSFRRARAVRDYLVDACAVRSDRLVVRGFGEHLPLVTEVDAETKQKNRRVEFELAR